MVMTKSKCSLKLTSMVSTKASGMFSVDISCGRVVKTTTHTILSFSFSQEIIKLIF